MAYDELGLDTLGDRKSALFFIISDTDSTFNFLIAMAFTQLFNGRMLEIYVVTSLGPIPMATLANRDWGQMGQNYLKSLLALGFQGFLIMVCVGIYAVLVQTISTGQDIHAAIWGCAGYTLLLCFALFKTGGVAKSVFGAH